MFLFFLKGRSINENRKLIRRDAKFEGKSNGQKELRIIQENDQIETFICRNILTSSHLLK